jgi:hypothetical protein
VHLFCCAKFYQWVLVPALPEREGWAFALFVASVHVVAPASLKASIKKMLAGVINTIL